MYISVANVLRPYVHCFPPTHKCSLVSSTLSFLQTTQLGTLGAGNHYAEVQVVEEVCDEVAAGAMGIGTPGQVVVMIHSGSRGLGHQV